MCFPTALSLSIRTREDFGHFIIEGGRETGREGGETESEWRRKCGVVATLFVLCPLPTSRPSSPLTPEETLGEHEAPRTLDE